MASWTLGGGTPPAPPPPPGGRDNSDNWAAGYQVRAFYADELVLVTRVRGWMDCPKPIALPDDRLLNVAWENDCDTMLNFFTLPSLPTQTH